MQTFCPLIYSIPETTVNAELDTLLATAATAGFDHILQDGNTFPKIAELRLAKQYCLKPIIQLSLDSPPSGSTLALAHPEWRYKPTSDSALPDPRKPHAQSRHPSLVFDDRVVAASIRQWWITRLLELHHDGIAGFCIDVGGPAPPEFFSEVIGAIKARAPACRFLAWTPGVPAPRVCEISACGFDAAFTSSAWWDFQSEWFAQELERLSQFPASIAIALPESSDASVLFSALSADGLMAVSSPDSDMTDALKAALSIRKESSGRFELEVLSPPGANGKVFRFMGTAHGMPACLLLLLNITPSTKHLAQSYLALNDGLSLGPCLWPTPDAEGQYLPDVTRTGSVALHIAEPGRPVITPVKESRRSVEAAIKQPRIAIENVSPSVEHGRFAAKRNVGDRLNITADIFGEGHDLLAACIRWRAVDDDDWKESSMQLRSNDRWEGYFLLDRVGRFEYQIVAWIDVFGAWRDEVSKKDAAGQQVELELQEGRKLIEEALAYAVSEDRCQLVRNLKNGLRDLDATRTARDAIDLMLSKEILAAMKQADVRPFNVRTAILQVDSERKAAGFGSWYELFPRSAGPDARSHGTFRDVMRELPRIRAMGFDVLYFPPIHPIGVKHRKGKNNSLTAGPNEPGSPYAIGSAAGGHEAVHPELGTIEDFRTLAQEAGNQGLEIALDFAIQCSPDHPWLKDHPEWFSWRPDGSIRYAENPPKKYQDIVNVDFYGAAAIPKLWLALRDVVLFWVHEGIRIFRVDNPHTKPLPFWEWLIAYIRARHPDVIFLAEAFTRPKPMYRLAKLGFSQSYSYFTWRHTKEEFITYLTELTQGEPKEYFRPNFFVNTPDINPYFVQRSGRAGFVIRAALAATLSGLWGMYSGFELCESEPVPGKEEYLNSEKYELRKRDWTQPGNIIREISLLNRIRRENPALRSHLGVKFCNSSGSEILCFTKIFRASEEEAPNIIFVAICLNPHQPQECSVEWPLHDWTTKDDAAIRVEDLVHGGRFELRGRHHQLKLEPDEFAFLIWRLVVEGAS